AAFLTLVFASCKKDNELHLDMGYGYAPSDIGRYVIYQVDSTVYDAFTKDTVYYKYQLKELEQSVFSDNEGRPSIRIERYVRFFNPALPYDSIPWTLKNVWYSTRTARDFERVESNVRLVKLIFPDVDQNTWNGNAQNTIGDWEYQYNGVNQHQNVGGFSFDSVATVIQLIDTNQINYRIYSEQYAKNVGLISKQIIDVYNDTYVTPASVLTRIKGGVIYKATVVAYGK
ncbi:MAG TPA: hypothetical protein VNZ86_15395, partial [Bacteroidia bacterium]|nr:hypothetical protein [Bacteroidia bacterium]